MDRRRIRQAYIDELRLYEVALQRERRKEAWAHLERAHILSQRYLTRHWHTHRLMLRMACEDRNRDEIRGQVRRLIAVPFGWAGGWVPKGNTGGADVHPLRPMALDDDLAETLAGYSPWKDVAVRLVLIVGVIGAYLMALNVWSNILERNGENLTFHASAEGYCELVPSIAGAEDIVVDRVSGIGFAVGGDRRAYRAGGEGRSKVFAFPLSDPTKSRDVSPLQPLELKGFGADLLRDDGGQLWLGIASRGSQGHSIEVFSVGENGILTHHHFLSAPDFVNPNDLVLLTPDSALVTLDKKARAGSLWEIFEGARRAPSGRVVKIRDGSMEVVADGLLSSNGIIQLDDGRLVIGELVGRRITIFGVNKSGDLQIERRIALPFGVDNLSTPDGSTVWAAGHPKLLTLARGYQKSEDQKAPSHAVSVDPITGQVTKLFSDTGKLLSASSVAVSLPDESFLIGTAFGPAAAWCHQEPQT